MGRRLEGGRRGSRGQSQLPCRSPPQTESPESARDAGAQLCAAVSRSTSSCRACQNGCNMRCGTGQNNSGDRTGAISASAESRCTCRGVRSQSLNPPPPPPPLSSAVPGCRKTICFQATQTTIMLILTASFVDFSNEVLGGFLHIFGLFYHSPEGFISSGTCI